MPVKRSVAELAAYIVLSVAIGVAIGVIAHNYRLPPIYSLFWPMDGTDDQPPIIVRNGSVIFEGGDSQNSGKGKDTWTQIDPKSPLHWKADHANGFDVNGFTVYVAGLIDPQDCQQTTMRADDVEIDYTTGLNVAMVFHVTHPDDGTKKHTEPRVDAADGSSLTHVTSGVPYEQLLGDAPNGAGNGTGWITRVASDDPTTGKPLTHCSLLQPGKDDRNLVRITIVPERK